MATCELKVGELLAVVAIECGSGCDGGDTSNELQCSGDLDKTGHYDSFGEDDVNLDPLVTIRAAQRSLCAQPC